MKKIVVYSLLLLCIMPLYPMDQGAIIASQKATRINENKKLLTVSYSCGNSIITSLCASYSKKLNDSIFKNLPPYSKSWSSYLYTPVVEYVYVGNQITASLSGKAWASSPHYDYALTIMTEKSSKVFTLEDEKLDFDCKGACANKDETLFACPYSNPYEVGSQGIFLVDMRSGISKKIACEGKTVACFGSYKATLHDHSMDSNVLFSFDPQGNIFRLSGNTEWQQAYTTWYHGIKGLKHDEINNRFIIWTGHQIVFYDKENRSSMINERSADLIEDVIIDPCGKKYVSKGSFKVTQRVIHAGFIRYMIVLKVGKAGLLKEIQRNYECHFLQMVIY